MNCSAQGASAAAVAGLHGNSCVRFVPATACAARASAAAMYWAPTSVAHEGCRSESVFLYSSWLSRRIGAVPTESEGTSHGSTTLTVPPPSPEPLPLPLPEPLPPLPLPEPPGGGSNGLRPGAR